MADYTAPTVLNCPRCGAAIAMQGEQGTCSYCGTPIEIPRRPLGGQGRPREVSSTRIVRRGVPLVLVLLVAALAAGGGFLAGRQQRTTGPIVVLPTRAAAADPELDPPSAPGPLELGGSLSISELVQALPRDGKGGDLLGYLYHSDSSRYSVALIDGGTQQLRWQSQPLSKNAHQGLVAVGFDRIFVTDGDQLLAFARRDGALAWQATLGVDPSPGCDKCLAVVGDYVAVLEKDGSVQVFQAGSGALAWQMRLDDRPDKLHVVGDRLAILVKADQKQRTVLRLLDPASGRAAAEIAPTCPPAHANFDEERLGSDSPLLFSPDGKRLTTMFGFFAKCAQAWDLASGSKLWETALDDEVVPSWWYRSGILETEAAIYFVNGNQVSALASADGALRSFAVDKDYTLTPLALHNGTLIVQAAPTWDSQRQEIWGLDPQRGERRWQVKLEAHDLREPDSSGDWEWRLMPDGLVVVQVLRDEARLIVERLDPASGKSTLRQGHALSGMTMPSLRTSLWADDTAWLQIDHRTFAIDLASGTIEYSLR